MLNSGKTSQQMNQLRACIAFAINATRNSGAKVNASRISRQFGCDIRIVRDVRNRIENSLPITKEYKHEKKKKITEAIGKFIETLTIANRTISGEAIAKLIFEKYQIPISKSYVNCYRRQIGFRYGPQIKTFPLTQAQKEKRLEFAKKYAENTFENVLFTDESYFELNGLRWVWRRKGEISDDILCTQQAHPKKIMVWGGISKKFKTKLVVFQENESMKSDNYISKILTEKQIGTEMDAVYEGGWVFMQDNAPPHKAKKTMEHIDKLGWEILGWTPHSPDLNIIEHIWAWMKRKVAELMPKSVEDLITVLNMVWDSIDQSHIDNLVASMPRRLSYLIKEQGRQIIGHI